MNRRFGTVRGFRQAGLWSIVTCMAVLGLLACSKSEPEAPAGPAITPTQPVSETPPVVEKPPLQLTPAQPGEPAVMPLLKLAPPSAAVVVTVPNTNALLEKGVALAKRLAPPETVDQAMSEAFKEIAEELDAPETASFVELVRGQGVDPEFPVGVYVNPADMFKSVAEQLKELNKARPPTAAPDSGTAAPDTPPPAEAPATGAAEAETPATPEPEAESVLETLPGIPTDMEMDLPDLVVVAGLADAAKAEAAIRLVAKNAGQEPEKDETMPFEDTVIHQLAGSTVYAIAGNVIVAGNNLDMLKEVLGRFRSPAEIRYGAPDVPLNGPDQVVMLTYVDRLIPVIREVVAQSSESMPNEYLKMQQQLMADYEKAFAGADPVIAVMEWTDKKIEVRAAVDCATHPGLETFDGEPGPFRLTALAPESTVVLIGQRVNAESKEILRKQWAGFLAEMEKNPGGAETIATIKQALDLVGDELMVSVSGGAPLPQVLAIVGINDKAKAKEFLEKITPLQPGETYQNAELVQAMIAGMLPVQIAFGDNYMALSNDVTVIKKAVDLIASGGQSGFLAQLTPPVDPSRPHYGIFLIKAELVTNVLQPYLAAFAAVPELQQMTTKVTSVFNEIRTVRYKNGTWMQQDLTVFLK